jgi:hypothetical protein
MPVTGPLERLPDSESETRGAAADAPLDGRPNLTRKDLPVTDCRIHSGNVMRKPTQSLSRARHRDLPRASDKPEL